MLGHDHSLWVTEGRDAPNFGQFEEAGSCVDDINGMYALWIIRNWVSRQVSLTAIFLIM